AQSRCSTSVFFLYVSVLHPYLPSFPTRRSSDLVANAVNAEIDAAELTARAEGFEATVDDASDRTSLIAVQGPVSEQILHDALFGPDSGVEGLTAEDLAGVGNYRFAESTYRGEPMLIARTGYTGEDGFELYMPDGLAAPPWEQLAAAGGGRLVPCGPACRDTLRLEAGMPLYGNELGRDLFPAQSGLGRVVGLKSKGDFVGRAGIEAAD